MNYNFSDSLDVKVGKLFDDDEVVECQVSAMDEINLECSKHFECSSCPFHYKRDNYDECIGSLIAEFWRRTHLQK